MGNPRRKHAKHVRKHVRHHRRWHNPALAIGGIGKDIMAAPKEMISRDFLTSAAGVAVGFVAPNLIITRLPAVLHDAPWKVYASKVVVVGTLSAVASVANKKLGRMILLGGGVSIILDLWQDYVAPRIGMSGAQVAAPKVGHYYGGMEHYFGDGQLGAEGAYASEGDAIAGAFGDSGE